LRFEETSLGALTTRDQRRNGLSAMVDQTVTRNFGQRPKAAFTRFGHCNEPRLTMVWQVAAPIR